MPDMLFVVFVTAAVLAATGVILIKNPVQAVFSLIACFLATAVTWLMLDAEFLAWSLILIYVGAVMVLFLFVVMMLDLKTLVSKFGSWLFIGLAVTTALIACILSIMSKVKLIMPLANTLAYGSNHVNNAKLLGATIFTQYLAPVVVAGLILLAAMVAAIALIYRGPHNRKSQNINAQIKANPRERVELVDG